ncbi:MAG: hypothetical protein DLM64_14200 [Solirubrobacterales bacterium]|nr:MAG: hypothetical protein DLM64_14200 [Solirubrobacterales bacterium]
MRAMRTVLVAGAICALTGCATIAPPSAQTTTQSKLAQAQTTHEYPSPAPPAQQAGGAASALQAIGAFAQRYINWTADTVTGQMRSLASESVGQARSAMALAAAQTAGNYELQRGGIANGGTIEAIAPLIGARNRYVVVTRELTTATNTSAYQGLRPAWHLALATVVQLSANRWVLSGWQPEG